MGLALSLSGAAMTFVRGRGKIPAAFRSSTH
jgi:hypothetical protein